MRYTVTSAPRVDEILAAMWLAATDRQGLSKAADGIEEVLRQAPLDGVPVDNFPAHQPTHRVVPGVGSRLPSGDPGLRLSRLM